MSTTSRKYARQIRTVGAFTVHAYSILTTDHVVFDVLEAQAGHTTVQSLGDDGRYGAYLSRPLPADIACLGGDERVRLVGHWHRSLDVTAEEIIRSAFPEVFGPTCPGTLKHGHGSCDLDDFNAAVKS